MRYLVAYDVADDARRNRIAGILLNYGRRIQESVFVCDIDSVLRREMEERLWRQAEATEDRVHVIGICEACWGTVVAMGLAEKPVDPPFYVV